MKYELIKSGTSRVLLTVMLVVFLAACGGGGDSGGGSGSSGSSLTSGSSSQSTGSSNTGSSNAQEVVVEKPDTGDDNTQSSNTPVGTGSFDLSWIAPVSRSDGTPLSLSDIGGFTVYYGKSPGSYTNYIDVPNATAQGVTLANVPVGTYYVVMTTRDNQGRESGYSSMITKTVL